MSNIMVSYCSVELDLDVCDHILFEKIYLYFSIGNGQPRQPALCHLGPIHRVKRRHKIYSHESLAILWV